MEEILKMRDMDISCATLVYSKKTNKYLLVHPTNSPFWDNKNKCPAKIWGLPKGINENSETFIETAIRELEEETGIKANKDNMYDIGLFEYKSDKMLYIFAYPMEDEVKNLHCDSLFTDVLDNNIKKPEIDMFRYVTKDEISTYMNTKMYKSVGLILKKKSPWRYC